MPPLDHFRASPAEASAKAVSRFPLQGFGRKDLPCPWEREKEGEDGLQLSASSAVLRSAHAHPIENTTMDRSILDLRCVPSWSSWFNEFLTIQREKTTTSTTTTTHVDHCSIACSSWSKNVQPQRTQRPQRFAQPNSASAIFRSISVVIFKFRSSPFTRWIGAPIRSIMVASSVKFASKG